MSENQVKNSNSFQSIPEEDIKPMVTVLPGYQPYIAPPSTLYFSPTVIPNYGSTLGGQQEIVIVGVCPACRVGMLETEYSCLCVCCILCCFPCGLGKHRRCNNCGAYFG